MSFSVTGAHVCVVLFYFVYPFVGVGAACGWVVNTAGPDVVPSCRGWVAGQL